MTARICRICGEPIGGEGFSTDGVAGDEAHNRCGNQVMLGRIYAEARGTVEGARVSVAHALEEFRDAEMEYLYRYDLGEPEEEVFV